MKTKTVEKADIAKVTRALRCALALALGAAAFVSPARVHAACTAGQWSVINLGANDVAQWPVRYESAHFAVRIEAANVGAVISAQAQDGLNRLESIWSQYMGRVQWPEPYCDSPTKHKVNVFINPTFGLSGGGRDDIEMAMWAGPGALQDWWGLAHEFGHSLQFNSRGNRDSPYVGWFWEDHAQFMAHQIDFNRSNAHCTFYRVANPHLYWGSTRDRYCSFQLLDFLKDKYGYGVVNDMWSKAPKPEDPNFQAADPFITLSASQGWSQSRLNDEFGDWAMHNVTWDYTAPDGYDEGAVMRKAYGANTDVSNPWLQNRTTRLEAIDDSLNQYQVPNYWAPQRYGYNLVQLFPSAGAQSVTVKFRGVVQATRPPVTFGTHVNDPGYGNNPQDNSAPNAGWRWGAVAVDALGKPRYSALQRSSSGDLTFPVESGDQSLWLVVVGAPTVHNKIFWDQEYASLYRYPWKLQLVNAKPAGYQPNKSTPSSNGHKHPNGGGWVADGAAVDSTAYVGPYAQVLGGSVLGNSRIEDSATIHNGMVRDNAKVGGMSNLFQNHNYRDNAKAYLTLSTQGTNGATFGGNVTVFGDLEQYCTSASQGAYSGILPDTACNTADPLWGGDRSVTPAEVTEQTPAGFPSTPTPSNGSLSPSLTAMDFSSSFLVASAPQTLKITNTSTKAVAPRGLALSGSNAFSITASTCGTVLMHRRITQPSTLQPGQSCEFTMIFRPMSQQITDYSASLTVSTNMVSLTGLRK